MIAWAGFVPHFCDVASVTLGVTVDTGAVTGTHANR